MGEHRKLPGAAVRSWVGPCSGDLVDELNPPHHEIRLDFHASRPGYTGSLVIDDGHHLLAVNLWDDEQTATAGRESIGPQVQRLLEPLMAAESELVAVGEVLADDREERQ
jgi:hypothetical protein